MEGVGIMKRIADRVREMEERAETGTRFNENGDPICFYCGKPLDELPSNEVHVDHIYPRSRGGENKDYNYVFACSRCNLSKRAKTPREWIQRLGDLPDDDAIEYIARVIMSEIIQVENAPFLAEVSPMWPWNGDPLGEGKGYWVVPRADYTSSSECPSCHEHNAVVNVGPLKTVVMYHCLNCGETVHYWGIRK